MVRLHTATTDVGTNAETLSLAVRLKAPAGGAYFSPDEQQDIAAWADAQTARAGAVQGIAATRLELLTRTLADLVAETSQLSRIDWFDLALGMLGALNSSPTGLQSSEGTLLHEIVAALAALRTPLLKGHLTVRDVEQQLRTMSELVAVATWVAESNPRETKPDFEQINTIAESTAVLRISYASPLEVALVVAPAVASSRLALAALISAARRLYGVDLELKTYREERRAEFLQAKRLAWWIEHGTDAPTWSSWLEEKAQQSAAFDGLDAALADDDAASAKTDEGRSDSL